MTINREHFLKVEKLYERHSGTLDPQVLYLHFAFFTSTEVQILTLTQDPQKSLFLLRFFSTQFTCFTGTRVHIMTDPQKALLLLRLFAHSYIDIW